MSWAKFDDALPTNAKFIDLSAPAKLAYILSVLYCSRELTDGRLSSGAIKTIFAWADIEGGEKSHVHKELIQSRLWEEKDGAIHIHDYLEYNPSKHQVVTRREEAKNRMTNLRVRANNTETSQDVRANNAGTSAEIPANIGGSSADVASNSGRTSSEVQSLPIPDSPSPSPNTKNSSSKQAASIAGLPAAVFSELLAEGWNEDEITAAKIEVESRPNHPRKITDWAKYLRTVLPDLRKKSYAVVQDRNPADVTSEAWKNRADEHIALQKEIEEWQRRKAQTGPMPEEMREILPPTLRKRKTEEEREREAREESERMKCVIQEAAAQSKEPKGA